MLSHADTYMNELVVLNNCKLYKDFCLGSLKHMITFGKGTKEERENGKKIQDTNSAAAESVSSLHLHLHQAHPQLPPSTTRLPAMTPHSLSHPSSVS